MADNTVLNLGSGGDTIATDDIGGVKYQRVKIVHGQDGQNSGDASHANPLPVEIQGSMTEFGALAIAQRTNQVETNFMSTGTLSTLLTLANTGSGASDWGSTTVGMATFSTGVTNPSTAKGTSPTTITYRAGEEVYVMFTASFTTGVAGTFQRVGLSDEVEGFWIGYEGTSFSVSVSTNSVITSVAQASFNVDPCQSGVGSDFTSAGAVQTLDPTKLNLYRIRFGWLGIGPAEFEVMSPDGIWVLMHQFRFPNSQATPSIRTPNLPIKYWLSSTGSNLIVKSSCAAAGIASPMVPKGTQPLYSLPVQRTIDAGRNTRIFMLDAYTAAPVAEALQSVVQWYGNAAVAGTTTPAVVPTGKTLRLTGVTMSTKSLATVGSAVLRIRANTAGTVVIGSPLVWSCECGSRAGATTVAMTGGLDTVTFTFPDGIDFPAGTGLGFTLAGYGPTGTLTLEGVTRFVVTGYEF